MYLHANAKLGLAGRLALVTTIDGGLSLRAAAAARTARRGCLLHSYSGGSATVVARRVEVRAWSRGRLASRTRPSGRCSSGQGSRVGRQRSRSASPTQKLPATPVLDRCQVGTYARGSASVRSLVLVSANLARMVEPKSRLRQNFVACGVTLRGSRETRVTGSGAPCSTTLDFAPTFNPNPLESFKPGQHRARAV